MNRTRQQDKPPVTLSALLPMPFGPADPGARHGIRSGVSIATSDRRLFTGSYIENAAFNTSLSPLETALAGLYAAGLNAAGIFRVVLVETEGAPISQSHVTRAALSSLAPAAKLEIFTARRSR